jgi:enamine deaminase RidA (YjgF/YER057c/UK114 family)
MLAAAVMTNSSALAERSASNDESRFGIFNEVYARYFPVQSPARIFLFVPAWPGPFDIEIDCVAVM